MSTYKASKPVLWEDQFNCRMDVESGVYKTDRGIEFLTRSSIWMGTGGQGAIAPVVFGHMPDELAKWFPEIADLTSLHCKSFVRSPEQLAVIAKYGLRLEDRRSSKAA